MSGYCWECECSREWCRTCGVCEERPSDGEHHAPCWDCRDAWCECGCGWHPRYRMVAHPMDSTVLLAGAECVERFLEASRAELADAVLADDEAGVERWRQWVCAEMALIEKLAAQAA